MSTTEIFVGRKGRILTGDQAGDYVLVQDDRSNTGGYLVLTCPDISFSGKGFDNWAEDLDQVKRLFEQFKWKIEWQSL